MDRSGRYRVDLISSVAGFLFSVIALLLRLNSGVVDFDFGSTREVKFGVI